MVLVFIVTLGIAMGGYIQLMQMRITETIQQKIFTRAAFDFTYMAKVSDTHQKALKINIKNGRMDYNMASNNRKQGWSAKPD